MTRVRRDDAGLTLAEMLIALLILGVGAVALVGAMGSLVRSSVTQKGFAANDSYAKTYLEAVKLKAAVTSWSCDLDLTPVLPSSEFQVDASWTWISGASGAAVQDCDVFAEARCPGESSPYPSECTPGAVRLTLKVTQVGAGNRPQVTTETETVLRRGNA